MNLGEDCRYFKSGDGRNHDCGLCGRDDRLSIVDGEPWETCFGTRDQAIFLDDDCFESMDNEKYHKKLSKLPEGPTTHSLGDMRGETPEYLKNFK